MAKKTKKCPDSFLKKDDSDTFSLEAISVMASACYFVREALEELAPKFHRGLGPVTKEAALAAVKELHLDEFVPDDVR